MPWTEFKRNKKGQFVNGNHTFTEFKKGGISPFWGKKHTEKAKNNNREKHLGIYDREKHPQWIKNRSKLAKRQKRNDMAYKEWRFGIWLRDGFKCRISNKDCEGEIIAHHILGWSLYPELRYEINNGITLCQAHHPRKRAEEKRLIPEFKELVSVSET